MDGHELTGDVLRGSAAGALATVPMSAVMLALQQLGALGEPPPRRLTRKLLKPLGLLRPSGARLDAAALVAHFGFGAAMGALWGLLPKPRRSPVAGALFGLGVWTANYAGLLPAVGLMPSPSHDRPARPTSMILAHLMYGAALAVLDRKIVLKRGWPGSTSTWPSQ